MIILSLGSNLKSKYGNRFDNIHMGLALLKINKIFISKISSFYETPSYPNKKKPRYINMVISAKTNLSPKKLMFKIFSIEKNLGRFRKKKNEPRIIDIDIIDYNSKIFNFTDKDLKLKIPHIDVSKRNFVLYPLKEIIPKWKHPKNNEIITNLINKLSDIDRKSILKIKKN